MTTPPLLRVAGLALASLGLAACQGTPRMSIDRSDFGTVDGRTVSLYTLESGAMTAKITDYGAIVTQLHVPDRDGRTADVVLGFDTVGEYVDHSPYFGAMCGRVGNRIAYGRFTLDGETYELATNNGPHHLHGGVRGFDKVVWSAEPLTTEDGPALRLRYRSPDGEEGYPGTVDVTVTYTLTPEALIVETVATTDRATPVNVVHHGYWNLAGHGSGDVLDEELMLEAARYTPADETLIPTGAIEPVAGTPLDFTTPKPFGRDIGRLPAALRGYDHNYVLDGEMGTLHLAARVRDPKSGRIMEITTTEPGIQVYTGNFIDEMTGKDGAAYGPHQGFCLETQRFPDAINKEGTPGWPSVVLRPGETYRHVMVHRFVAGVQ